MNPVSCSMQMEQVPVLQDSPKEKRRASGKFNLRKSLAWDSAFFTNEGVLDPEELAIVNSTFKKAESHGLPVIQEEMKKSFESSSTCNSGSWKIESIEVDLFENVRASIQRSYNAFDEARPVQYSSRKTVPGKLVDQCLCSSRKVGTSSKNMAKPPIASRKPGVTSKEKSEISKDNGHANMVKPPNASRKPGVISKGKSEISKDNGLANMVGSGNEYKKRSVKPSQISSRTVTTPTKRISNNLVWKSNGKAVPGSCHSGAFPNTIICREPCVVIPKSYSSKNFSGSPTLPKILPTASRSLYTGSRCTSFDQTNRTSQATARKKVDSWNKSIEKSISSSITKSPLLVSKGKNGIRSVGNHQAYLNSVSKLPSSVSPNSSIESAVSLSSTSSISARTGSFSSARSSSDSNSPHPSCLQTLQFGKLCGNVDQEGNSIRALRSPCVKVSSGARISEVSSAIDESRAPGNDSGTKGFKPSSLRMPSPKIGYFDADKSLLCNSIKGSQMGLQGTLRCTAGTGNDGIITPRSSNIPSLACMDSLPQIATIPQLSSSIIRPIAPASLPPSTPCRKASSRLIEDYDNLSSSNQSFSKNEGKKNSTLEVVAEDLIEHLKLLDVKSLDKTDLCSKPIEASNMISNAPGFTREANSDTDEQARETTVLGEKLSNEQSLPVSHNTESQLENSSCYLMNSSEKGNLLGSEDHKVIKVEQLEKRLSSLKLSLSDANCLENSGKLKSILNYCDSQRVELQNSSASPTYSPVNSDVLPRTPLVDSN